MTTPSTTPSTTKSPAKATPGAAEASTAAATTRPGSDLVTTHGTTTIADTVVEKIAGLAAREVNGVHDLGGSASRAFGAVRERIPGGRRSLGQGVSVEVGERQAAIDLDLIVEYGVPIGELSRSIRRNVISSIERMTALEVTEVNIAVTDVFIPGDDDDAESRPARVQ
jgi:uncharacterized alkaline shock family protein YloU